MKRQDWMVFIMVWLIAGTLAVMMAGCANKPAPTAEQLMTEEPEKKSRVCVDPDILPACPTGSTKYIEYHGRCVWSWGCVGRR